MVFNCNINAFSNLTSIIYLYNENINLEMTIKKLGSAYKFRVGRATGNEHIFLFGLNKPFSCIFQTGVRLIKRFHSDEQLLLHLRLKPQFRLLVSLHRRIFRIRVHRPL